MPSYVVSYHAEELWSAKSYYAHNITSAIDATIERELIKNGDRYGEFVMVEVKMVRE